MVKLNTRPMDDEQLDGRCEISESVHSELPYYVDHAEYFKYDKYTRQHHTHKV